MNTQETNAAIAKIIGEDDLYFIVKRGMFYRPDAHGYTWSKREAWRLPLAEAKKHEYPKGTDPVTLQKCPPRDFCGSHDAMAVAKKWIKDEFRRRDYVETLCSIVSRDNDTSNGSMTSIEQGFFASSQHQAEAFLKEFRE